MPPLHPGRSRAPLHRTAALPLALAVVGVAAFGRFVTAPDMAGGLAIVGLSGLFGWRCAAMTAVPAMRFAGPAAANDNPTRPCLPPHALRW